MIRGLATLNLRPFNPIDIFPWDFCLPLLAVFAILYDFFAGGFTSTYAGTVQELRRISTAADLGSIFRLLSAGRGVGNIICGPISEGLLRACHLLRTGLRQRSDSLKPGFQFQ